MANNQSWEFYQQPNTGTKYPLQWVAGAATAGSVQANAVGNGNLILIPFNQMRAATLSQIGVDVVARGGASSTIRLGIYNNNSSKDNYPTSLLVDAGELVVGTSGQISAVFLNVNKPLTADTRCWAAILCNDANLSVMNMQAADMIFWAANTASGALNLVTSIRVSQTYGALPANAPITGTTADLSVVTLTPAIILSFSAVT
jgi:hypothetical protein